MTSVSTPAFQSEVELFGINIYFFEFETVENVPVPADIFFSSFLMGLQNSSCILEH